MTRRPSCDGVARGLGQVRQRDVGLLHQVLQRQPQHAAADPLEDRDVLVVRADVVLLQHPHAGEHAAAGEHREHGDDAQHQPQPAEAGRRRRGDRVHAIGAVRVRVVADARAAARVRRRGGVAAVARGPADDRRVVAEVDVHDVRDDAGDVVRAAAAQREVDQPVRALARVRVRAQRVRQRLVADHAGQAVASTAGSGRRAGPRARSATARRPAR